MSVIVNHFNLGANYEAYFVCPEIYREYFTAVADYLEKDLAVKSDIFCYDSENLSEKVKRNLKRSKNVVFVLTEGATERAASDENDELRTVYGYVWKANPNSLSLMAVNECHIGYDIEYPPEMQSFKWLHRKKYELSVITVEKMAEELFREFRIGFTQTESRRLEKLAVEGSSGYSLIYDSDVRGMKGALLWECFSLAVTLLILFTKINENTFAPLLALLAAVFAGVGIGYLCYTLMRGLCARIELLDVSVLFGAFKIRTAQRVAALLGVGMWGGIWYLAILFIDFADKNKVDMKIALIGVFVVLIAFTIIQLVKASILSSAAFLSSHYIKLCEKRPRIHITFAVVYAIVLLVLGIAAAIVFL